jgi:hypothetical protein
MEEDDERERERERNREPRVEDERVRENDADDKYGCCSSLLAFGQINN